MNKMMHCRMAQPDDLDFIFKIEKEIFKEPWTKESIDDELNRSKNKLNIINCYTMLLH